MVLYLDCLKGSIMPLALTLQFCQKTIVWKNSGWETWENWETDTQDFSVSSPTITCESTTAVKFGFNNKGHYAPLVQLDYVLRNYVNMVRESGKLGFLI